MRLAGQAVDQQQYMLLQRRNAGIRGWIMAALYLLWAFFLLELYAIAVSNESGVLMLLALCVLPLSLLTGLAYRHHHRQQLQQQYAAYAVAYAGEIQTELFGDRLVQRTTYLCQTLFFSPETTLLELGNMLLVYDGGITMILRAADVTDEQAQQFYQYLCARIPKERRRVQTPFYARRQERLPVSPLPAPTVYMQFAYTRLREEDERRVQRMSRTVVREKWLTLLALSLSAAGIIAGLYTFTAYLTVDTLLMTGVIFPLLMGFAYGMSRWWYRSEQKRRQARYPDRIVQVAVTEAGFVVHADGCERLILPTGLTVREQEERLEIESIHDLLMIPLSAVPNAALLRQLLATAGQ